MRIRIEGQPSHEFFIAYAQAMLCWQHVEHGLFLFFNSLFNAYEPAAASIYYTQESFGAKLRVVDAAAKVTLKGTRAKDWKILKKKLESKAGSRNALAHLAAVFDYTGGGAMGLAMAAPVFAPKEVQRSRATKIDAAECERLSDHFIELGKQLSEL